MDCSTKKRVRRGESFGRMGVDRSISNSLKSPSRQKQKPEHLGVNVHVNLKVRFAEETPMIYLCSHYEQDMTQLEVNERKKELWYSRNDFESFLRERISTIRLLKVVEGDALALRKHCPDLCLRGLEPYQCDTLNQELQCQRHMHQRVVLTEQTIQKSSQKQPDPESIRRLALGRSEWARKRAQQLASMDEMEVKAALTSASTAMDTALQVRRRSLTSGLENLMLNQRNVQQQHQQQQRRASLTNLSLAAPRRVPVDMAILKEWNAKFLQDIRHKNGNDSGADVNAPANTLSDKTEETRRALGLQRSSLLFGTLNAAAGATANTAPLATTGTSNTTLGYELLVSRKDATGSTLDPSFRFPVRRDSLVGLRRESFLANKAAATVSMSDPASTAMGTLAAAAAAVSSSGVSSLGASSGLQFRFPLRRDSLSNVHWN